MLFFGAYFSHLVCYFGYFLEIQWYFSKLKKSKFGTPNLGQVILGKTAVLVILNIIYVNFCDYFVAPKIRGQ